MPDWVRMLRPLAAGEGPVSVPEDLPYRDLVPARLVDAAVLVPILSDGEAYRVVLTVRTHELREHAGQISFPGGRVDLADRSRLDAALRETSEEVGIAPHQVLAVGCLDPIITITGYTVIPFVGLVQEPVQLTPEPGEVAEIFTVPLSHLADPANHQRRQATYRGQRREFSVIAHATHYIWGATAAMLVDLGRRVGHTWPPP